MTEREKIVEEIWLERLNIRPFLSPQFPEIVCLCGSTRFMEAFQKAKFDETLAGRIVLTIGCDTKSDGDLFSGPEGEAVKERLDRLHFYKIDLADTVLILNVKTPVCNDCGKPLQYDPKWGGLWCREGHGRQNDPRDVAYIGSSTRRELEYARSKGKKIRFLEPLE
jgi:hypothetical protein